MLRASFFVCKIIFVEHIAVTISKAKKPHTLTLARGSKSRPSGQWSDDDYDVFHGHRHNG